MNITCKVCPRRTAENNSLIICSNPIFLSTLILFQKLEECSSLHYIRRLSDFLSYLQFPLWYYKASFEKKIIKNKIIYITNSGISLPRIKFNVFVVQQQEGGGENHQEPDKNRHKAGPASPQRTAVPRRDKAARAIQEPVPNRLNGYHIILRGWLQLRSQLFGVGPNRLSQVPTDHRFQASDRQVAVAGRQRFRLFRQRPFPRRHIFEFAIQRYHEQTGRRSQCGNR